MRDGYGERAQPRYQSVAPLVWTPLPDSNNDFLNPGLCEYMVLVSPKPVAVSAAPKHYDSNTFTCLSSR
jgi:hypothetical protein